MGEGPNEYFVPTSIHLDENKNLILLTDWEKMSVVSFDFEGNFIASKKFPGKPILLFQEKDTLLALQEDASSYQEANQMNLIVSTVDPNSLEVKHQEGVLYSYKSKLRTFFSFPGIVGRLNETLLFYLPRPRFEGLIEHKDTIYKKVENHLVPEHLLHFTEFDRADTLSISHLEMFNGYASILLSYKKKGYFIMLDLEKNSSLYCWTHPVQDNFSGLDIENIPKPIKENVFYAILRDNESEEEKNPKIVFYRFGN